MFRQTGKHWHVNDGANLFGYDCNVRAAKNIDTTDISAMNFSSSVAIVSRVVWLNAV
ncbi:MAG: hypothetical protein R3C28_14900 [Pirellulaceae bacterium]